MLFHVGRDWCCWYLGFFPSNKLFFNLFLLRIASQFWRRTGKIIVYWCVIELSPYFVLFLKGTNKQPNFAFLVRSRCYGCQVGISQPHLAQCYSRSRRIALISCRAHESEIYFEVQLGVNQMVLSRVKWFAMWRDVLLNRFSHRGVKSSIITGCIYV